VTDAHFAAPAPAFRPERARLRAGGAFAIALAVLINVAAVAGTVWVVNHPQRVVDQIRVWQYEPNPDIFRYAKRSTMTEEGRFLFYASLPSVDSKETFNGICATQLEDVGILGCYLPSERRIHLFDVTDDRLDGIEEVVASHEMLHAVWDRLDDDERERLGVLLEAEVAARADDTALAETLAFYAKAEPGQRLNELHSIVGTEFADISPELEEHYATYFADRSALVALHEKSNAVFVEQAAAIDELIGRIDALAAGIDADYAAYNAGYDQLNADIDNFNARADAGSFASQAAFDAERNALLNRQAELDAQYESIDARATEYDGLVEQLTALNAQVDQLNQSINIAPRSESGL